MNEIHSRQYVHPPCQSAEWLTWEWTVTISVQCYNFLKFYIDIPYRVVILYHCSIREHNFGGLAQLGERLPCKQEVTSSTLVFSTKAVNTARTEKETLRSCSHESERFFFCSHRANAREWRKAKLFELLAVFTDTANKQNQSTAPIILAQIKNIKKFKNPLAKSTSMW